MIHEELDKEAIYVLDTSVFINSLNSLFRDLIIVTSPYVEQESLSSKAKINFEHSKLSGMEIISPSKRSMDKVSNKVKATNDKLSITDISVIALTLDFLNKKKKAILVTEDYGIQNICSILEIPYISILNKPISKKFKWIKRCANCGKTIKNEKCDFCGSKEIKYTPRSIS